MHLYILGSDPAGLAGGGKDRAYAATGPKYEQKYHPNSGLSILHTDMQPMRHDLSIFLTIYPFRARRSAKVVCPSRSINDAGELSVRYRCPSPPLFIFFFLFFLSFFFFFFFFFFILFFFQNRLGTELSCWSSSSHGMV